MILLGLMLSVMAMRVFLPIGAKVTGRQIKAVRLSFRERLLLQRLNIYAIAVVLLLTILLGVLPQSWEVIVIMAVFAIMLVPVHYTITTEGIGLNNVVFRPWGDFAGVEPTRRRIRLVARPGLRHFDLCLLGQHQTEAVAALRSLVGGNRTRKGEAMRKSRSARALPPA